MLAVHHRHLFNGSLEERLSKSYHIKRVWLASVWAACETTDINHLKNNQIQTDTTIRLRYEQWKKRYQCDILDWFQKTTTTNLHIHAYISTLYVYIFTYVLQISNCNIRIQSIQEEWWYNNLSVVIDILLIYGQCNRLIIIKTNLIIMINRSTVTIYNNIMMNGIMTPMVISIIIIITKEETTRGFSFFSMYFLFLLTCSYILL